MIKQYNHLGYIQEGEIIIVEVLYTNGYGNWNIFAKGNRITPIGFYCKRFPWSENKYSLFERTIWATYEACKAIHSLIKNNETIIRTEMPIMDWIKAPGEAWVGLPIEPKVLHWKWYLADFIKHHQVTSKGRISQSSDAILRSGGGSSNDDQAWLIPPDLIPKKKEKEERQPNIGTWGTKEYTASVPNAWFTDGSSTTVNNKISWKAAAYRPEDGKIITDQGTGKSAQHAEVLAALLAARQTKLENKRVLHLYTDSWCVANGIAVWSGKWRKTSWKINGKDIWSIDAWKELDELSKEIKIIVYHVDAHTSKKDDMHKYNDVVDKLASLLSNIKIKKTYKIEDIDPLKKRIKTEYKIVPKKEELKPTIEVGLREIQALHEQMGHIGTHALKQWMDQRHIDVSWQKIRQAIKQCNGCPNDRLRFNHNYHGNIGSKKGFNSLVQIDFIGPLKKYKNLYACTMVDATTGLGMARVGTKPDQQTCILTILQWSAQYGTPQIIQSDQGSHFTGKLTQKCAETLGIMWDFHQSYNPTSAGAIERWNGLLKTQLMHRIGETLSKAILWATLELNQRQRLHRKSPIEEAIAYSQVIEYPQEDNRNIIRPHICVHRSKKDDTIHKAEVVAPGPGNNIWITQVVFLRLLLRIFRKRRHAKVKEKWKSLAKKM
ncbi:uncharacterized protein LOC104854215 [Fukomys damarensis]|uniref:uncharacterized protein LOC104854215 n=1 Tax=Fukomys damarensis TaxID=885580 RepID=UPI00145527D1|nr:uncharacterized protein LOC104854215 [Fukomys damarensis]